MNLQLDHFPMTQNQQQPLHPAPRLCACASQNQKPNARRLTDADTFVVRLFEHGIHNVSRWMTWLPISLKNAAKCDKWYQLQNLSITESLNANGAREKPPTAIPVHAVSLSVEQKPNGIPQRIIKKSLGLSRLLAGAAVEWLSRVKTRQTVDSWITNVSIIRGCLEVLVALSRSRDQQVQSFALR